MINLIIISFIVWMLLTTRNEHFKNPLRAFQNQIQNIYSIIQEVEDHYEHLSSEENKAL
jgi:hypothetical protein